MASILRKIAGVALIALAVAGCDKCGNRVQFVAPTLQHACGDNSGGR